MGRIKVLKQEKCIECDTIGVLCKSLCPACYRRKTRNTPEGKLKIKLYYDTASRKRFLNKKPKKEPKEKTLCECGKISIVKNMCRNCYQNKRNKENYVHRPKKIKLVDVKIEMEKFDLSVKIGDRNIGKFFHKARVGQSITKQFAMKEITEYVKSNSDLGSICYLSIENQVLHLEDYYDCKLMYIDMNKIYKH